MNTMILTVAMAFAGLMAGLFYAWSISVTPGLAQVNDQNYLQAFQAMNRAILNPAFFIVFFGQAVILPLLSYLFFKTEMNLPFSYILIATLLYWIGCMGVTIFGNVPLNNMLEVLQIDTMTMEQMADFRLGFERKWNRLNWIRAFSTLFSFVFLILACLQMMIK